MNIKEAKTEIINTLHVYHKKDKFGNYTYPIGQQRPILLMGPPGIGKTAILEQIAKECNVGLVSYTITHHTRQSAVGLPEIVQKKYMDQEFSVTEYTMSEIVAAVYECIERTGKKEGILFIDEINCVSETLTPTMLQFLQKKTFGTHRIPEGYLIVAAGNPVKFNRAAREFDIVTLDRIRCIEIDADLKVWLKYAANQGIHGSILSYLNIKEDNFYYIDQTRDGKHFVTARGWEDLGKLITAYEEAGFSVEYEQIREFLQEEEIARSFASYYHLYCKYREDYGISELLQNVLSENRLLENQRFVEQSSFEERMTVIGMIQDAIFQQMRSYHRLDRSVANLYEKITYLKRVLCNDKDEKIENRSNNNDYTEWIEDFIQRQKEALKIKCDLDAISEEKIWEERYALAMLETYNHEIKQAHITNSHSQYDKLKELFLEQISQREELITTCRMYLEQGIRKVKEYFGNGHELVMLISGILDHEMTMEFISRHGSEAFLDCSAQIFGLEGIDSVQEELREACKSALNK